MRTPAEQLDKNDTGIAPDAEHEHGVRNYVWGVLDDGTWQIGKCVICHEECRRTLTWDHVATEWSSTWLD